MNKKFIIIESSENSIPIMNMKRKKKAPISKRIIWADCFSKLGAHSASSGHALYERDPKNDNK
jgi:hypothetical protein